MIAPAIVGVVVALAEWRVIAHNVGTLWNGMGTTDTVVRRTADAPMRYRVLMPWLLHGIAGAGLRHSNTDTLATPRCRAYLATRIVMSVATMTMAHAYIGTVGMLVLAVAIMASAEFDYWEHYVELIGVMACLYGQWWIILPAAIAWGMSKETVLAAPLLVIAARPTFAAAGDYRLALCCALVGVLTLVVIKHIQGNRATLYCDRWTLTSYNLSDLRLLLARLDMGYVLSVLVAAGTVALVLFGNSYLPPVLSVTRVAALAWVVTGWTMARARETRIFLPCAIWLAGLAEVVL